MICVVSIEHTSKGRDNIALPSWSLSESRKADIEQVIISMSFTLVNLCYFYSRKKNYANDDFQASMFVISKIPFYDKKGVIM